MTIPLADIYETFDLIGDDWDERYRYIIELGRALPPFPEAARTPENKVRGCSSQVWMTLGLDDQVPRRIIVHADSDAHIVRGLIAILLSAYQDKTPEQATGFNIKAILDELKLSQALSPTRTNGLFAMVERIRNLSGKIAA